jgi:tRNA(Ile)-lysidine synthase
VDIREIARSGKTSVEAAGRTVRYGFFENVRARSQARFVITAHHRDDSIETVLINLIRGARLRGLSGMAERQGTLLRPLLEASKASIRSFAETRGIAYREDSTNADSRYVRNRVRNDILPQMEAINPSVRDTLADFAEYAGKLDRMVEGLLAVHLSGNSIREEDFAKLPELLRLAFVEKIYGAANGGTIGLSAGNMEEICRFILEARGGTVKELGKLRLEKRGRKVGWGD